MAFHEIRLPLRLALATSGGPVRRTDIVSLSNGREYRNRRWANSRRAYDVGSGIRSAADLAAVLAFFEARGGAFHGFRFRDPLDWTSAAPGAVRGAFDQVIGIGTGTQASFQLVKTYGDAAGGWQRTITKPVAGTVQVAVNGQIAASTACGIDTITGLVTFLPGQLPSSGATVTAGFDFDVPVRFASDRLEISLEAFQAGRIPTIPLLEIVP
nr:DUF2460 domain-containing protein [uncultured Gellertiella sp.]